MANSCFFYCLGLLLVVGLASSAANEFRRLDIKDHHSHSNEIKAPSLTLVWNGESFDLTFRSDQGAQELMGRLGTSGSIPSDLGNPRPCDLEGLCWEFGSLVTVSAKPKTRQPQCYSVEWRSQLDSLKDCYQLSSAHWYGGGEVFDQSWPIEGDSSMMGGGRPDLPYVTGDTFSANYGGVMEPYWINSNGFGIYALRENPLFVSWNASGDREFCLSSRYDYPYPRDEEEPDVLTLRYDICSAADVKAVHLLALSNGYWEKPRAIPDQKMFTDPIWSTWARMKVFVNETNVMNFAQKIRNNGFNDSQLEIDDRWETCYGDFTFDSSKFPDPKNMVDQLHNMGFRVTLWIHPFINIECSTFSSAQSHVVQDAKGIPALTSWWQGSVAGYYDFTRPSAADWWTNRVLKIRTDYGFDGFKVDAGETNWLPAGFDFVPQLTANATPNGFSTAFVNNMERFGGMTEVRTGYNSQAVPIFTRMLDKDTKWTKDNGLATLIPTLLHFGLEGYVFVLPDMIGGNGYNRSSPSKELFVRWMQANVFMPSLQFSYAPWDYDAQVVEIAQRMTSLHYEYAPTIIGLAQEAVTTGFPINRPIWWIDPSDPDAQTIDSEYLLGDDLLVAPVVEEGAVSRDIYIPTGRWRDEADPAHPIYTGPRWLRGYVAPLEVLPYFTRAA